MNELLVTTELDIIILLSLCKYSELFEQVCHNQHACYIFIAPLASGHGT